MAKIHLKHKVIETTDRDEADIIAYKGVDKGFYMLMDFLYPEFMTNDHKCTNGYLGFLRDGRFIGCVAGNTMASVRKNPYLGVDNFDYAGVDKDIFLKFCLAVNHLEGITTIVNRCKPSNYGTLRLWQKLGVGIKVGKHGDCLPDEPTENSLALLNAALSMYKEQYIDIRNEALLVRSNRVEYPRFIPKEEKLIDQKSEPKMLKVELL